MSQVEGFTCGPSKVGTLLKKIDTYADVSAYVRKSRGGLMEKLSSFSAGVGSKLALPDIDMSSMVSSSHRGIMEKLEDMDARTARQPSMNQLTMMHG